MKNKTPLKAPGKVRVRMSRTNIMTYGNRAKKYEAFPELLTPLIITAPMNSHDMARAIANFQLGAPMPSSIFDFSFKTIFLEVR